MTPATIHDEQIVRRELAVPVRLSETERAVVQPAVNLVLDESPDDETAEAMTDYAVELAAAIALRTGLENGSLPAGTDLGPLGELVGRVRLAYVEIAETNHAEPRIGPEHWASRDAVQILAGCDSLLARL